MKRLVNCFFLATLMGLSSCCFDSSVDHTRKPITLFVKNSTEYISDSIRQFLPENDTISIKELYTYQSRVGDSVSTSIGLKFSSNNISEISRDSLHYFPGRILLLDKWVFMVLTLGKGIFVENSQEYFSRINREPFGTILVIGNPLTGEIIRIEYGGHRLCNTFFGHYEDILYDNGALEWFFLDSDLEHDRKRSLDLFLHQADSVYWGKYNEAFNEKIKFKEITCEELLLSSIIDNRTIN